MRTMIGLELTSKDCFELCAIFERRVAKVKVPEFWGYLTTRRFVMLLLVSLPGSLKLLSILSLLHQVQAHKICKVQSHLTKHARILDSLP